MGYEMTALEQINRIAHQLPKVVLQDIHQRIADWRASGGGADDPYIYQQLRFAQNVIRSGRNEQS